MERLLGAIARALDGLVEGNYELRQAFADLRKVVAQASSRTDGRIGDLQIAVDGFVLRVEAVIEHQKIVAGSTHATRAALNQSQQKLEKSQAAFVVAVEKISSEMAAVDPKDFDGASPRVARVLAVRVTNFLWPIVIKKGPIVVKVIYVASWGAMASLMKIVYPFIAQIGKLF